MLRIESENASKAFIRSVKLHWLDFDRAIHIDGIHINNGHHFMGSEVEINLHNFGLTNTSSDKHGSMTLIKFYPEPIYQFKREFVYGLKIKFACQKANNERPTVEDIESPFKVDVVSRILLKLGSVITTNQASNEYDSDRLTTFFKSRGTDFTPLSASLHCKS